MQAGAEGSKRKQGRQADTGEDTRRQEKAGAIRRRQEQQKTISCGVDWWLTG